MQRPDINKLKELKAHATKGTWVAVGKYGHIDHENEELGQIRDVFEFYGDAEVQYKGKSNAEYTAALHNANLIEYIEWLESEIDKLDFIPPDLCKTL